jgi:signal transduction histidine kinase
MPRSPQLIAADPPGAERRLATRVAIGALVGTAYVALDAYLDFGPPAGKTIPLVSALHAVVDFVLPILTGGLMGLAVHFLRLRADAVTRERRRAEELRGHLHRIERDQAVWVVAASLLHELRNPLHSLGLLLDELEALPEDDAERPALLARARAQHERVTTELGTLRSLPASEAPELPRLDVSVLAGRCVGEMAPLLRGGPLRIVLRAPAPVPAAVDATYVQIILENLVENALDALRERGAGGLVEVEVIESQGHPVIRVRDDGPGIPADEAPTIFEPLHTTKARGMGLGLAIARALARAMGGDLLLESARPATFRLDLSAP